MSEQIPCQCVTQDYPFRCPVFQKEQSAEMHAICAGRLRPGQRDRYRRTWMDLAEGRAVPHPSPPPDPNRKPLLTIGMATANESHNVWWTVQSLRMNHADAMAFCEIVVVDNAPHTPHGRQTRATCERIGVRYVEHPEPQGTSAPRQRIVDEANAENVLVMDSHVMLDAKAVIRLINWFHANPGSIDLLHGPMLDCSLPAIHATHMVPEWGSDAMFGRWGKSDEPCDTLSPPFEIPMHGLGVYAFRKDAWPGFNPAFRGFGGEEGYIHDKFRRAGGRVLCLPFLRWLHWFRPATLPMPYRATWEDRLHNYAVGHKELGKDLADVERAFSDKLPMATIRSVIDAAPGPAKPAGDVLADVEYRAAVKTPSDIFQHLPTLKRLATGCETVVELGVRHGVSTRALIAARPKRVVSVDVQEPPAELAVIAATAGVDWQGVKASSLDVEPVPSDLLFVDTLHTADQLRAELARHAPHCRSRIVLHDTETFGVHGEGGGDGLLKAVAEFLSANSAEWELERHYKHCHGLTVLRRWNVETDKSRGLGDDVAKVAHAIGVDKLAKAVGKWFGADCGCAGRQASLNKWFSYEAKS